MVINGQEFILPTTPRSIPLAGLAALGFSINNKVKHITTEICGKLFTFTNLDPNYHLFSSPTIKVLANGKVIHIPNLSYQPPDIKEKWIDIFTGGQCYRVQNLDVHYDRHTSKNVRIWRNGQMIECDIAPDRKVYSIEHSNVNINGLPLKDWTHYVPDQKGYEKFSPEIRNVTVDPKTPYVSVFLKVDQRSEPIKVTALHDSGCEKTIMHTRIFERLRKTGKLELTPLNEVAVSSCTGDKSIPAGVTNVIMMFEGENGNTASFPHQALVHDGIEKDFLLGRDFTGSAFKLLETNDFLYLTDSPTAAMHNDKDVLWATLKDKAVNVPIHNEYKNKFRKLLTNAETTISPYTSAVISCHLEETSFVIATARPDNPVFFEINKIIPPNVVSPEALFSITNAKDIQVTLCNVTDTEITFDPGSHIANIVTQNDIEQTFELQVSTANETIISCSHLSLNDDEGLNEEEKEQMFLDYLEKGQYTPSMTGYIENTPSITEMSYKDTTSWSDADFDTQFKLGHLPMKVRQQVLSILRQFKNVFSRHEMDIGLASNIEMEIEVDNTKPRIQKYYPLPHAVREQTKKILDQMIEYGLLRECKEPSNFLANLLVTKKKDGSVRVLLDGRLLNQATIRKATIMTAPLEIFTALAGKKHITLVDVSNAFWHIPIKYEHQPYTAFYSEAHGKRFCYTRAPQGLKNSPVYLHFLMCEMLAPFVQDVIHYADDLMIATGTTIHEHLQILQQVLRRLQEYNIKLKPAKLEILKDEVEFLGIVWKKGTLNIPVARVQGFRNLTHPSTPKKVKSFICAMASGKGMSSL